MSRALARSTRLGCLVVKAWGGAPTPAAFIDSFQLVFDAVLRMRSESAVNQRPGSFGAITCRHVDTQSKSFRCREMPRLKERVTLWQTSPEMTGTSATRLAVSDETWHTNNVDLRNPASPPSPCITLFPLRYCFWLELIGWAVPCLITGIHLGESQAALNDLSCLRGSDKSLCSINQSAFSLNAIILNGHTSADPNPECVPGPQRESELCTAAS